jgi:spore germination protein
MKGNIDANKHANREERKLATHIQEHLKVLQAEFADCSDVMFRQLRIANQVEALLVYIDGLVKAEELQTHVLRPLLTKVYTDLKLEPDAGEIADSLLTVSHMTNAATYEDSVLCIVAGNAMLFIEGEQEALVLSIAGGDRRAIQESSTEAVIRGPKEAFNESIRTSTSLVRSRIRTSKLKMVPFTIGEQTKTQVVLSYIEGIADPSVIAEVKRRLAAIRMDSVLESGYIEELIEDNPYSPFPQMRYSEKPDSVASQLLEGRFAIFVDGTPFSIKGPTNFWQFMQASDDYYERYMISNFIRWLRYLFLMIALLLPALYVATTTYHQDMLPTTLILSIAAAREAIPFPAMVEALIMEIAFEALREASIRLPKTVGQAVSILGALVIGQAAVSAGIVSAPVVIVVSLTGIASFSIPRFNMAIAVRLLRFPMLIMAGLFGLFGIILGMLWIGIHLCQLTSFGVPYLSGMAPYRKGDSKDIFVRVPWWKMVMRPSGAVQNRRRMAEEMQRGATPVEKSHDHA